MTSEYQNHNPQQAQAITPSASDTAQNAPLDDASSNATNAQNEELTPTELQILKAMEKLEKLKEKAAKEKKKAEEKHEKEILTLLKKAGLLKHSKEEWQAKIEEVKMVFDLK